MYYTRTIWDTLWSLVVDLTTLIGQLSVFLLGYTLLIVWTAWWLWAVNWPRLWDVLRRGAWAPFVLLLLVSALVWSRLSPGPGTFLGVTLPTFWWQLGQVGLLAAYTLFLGWVQGIMHWAPAEISLEPPAHPHDDHHSHHHEVSHAHGHPGHDSVTEPKHTQPHHP